MSNRAIFFPHLTSLSLFGADVSTTMIVKPGPVVDFLLSNQKVGDPHQIDWKKVIKSSHQF